MSLWDGRIMKYGGGRIRGLYKGWFTNASQSCGQIQIGSLIDSANPTLWVENSYHTEYRLIRNDVFIIMLDILEEMAIDAILLSLQADGEFIQDYLTFWMNGEAIRREAQKQQCRTRHNQWITTGIIGFDPRFPDMKGYRGQRYEYIKCDECVKRISLINAVEVEEAFTIYCSFGNNLDLEGFRKHYRKNPFGSFYEPILNANKRSIQDHIYYLEFKKMKTRKEKEYMKAKEQLFETMLRIMKELGENRVFREQKAYHDFMEAYRIHESKKDKLAREMAILQAKKEIA